MRLGKDQVKEARRDVKRIPRTDNCNFSVKRLEKLNFPRKVRFADPHAVISDALSLKSTELQGDVRVVPHHLL